MKEGVDAAGNGTGAITETVHEEASRVAPPFSFFSLSFSTHVVKLLPLLLFVFSLPRTLMNN